MVESHILAHKKGPATVSLKVWPNLNSNLLYKMGQDFLDK